MSEPACAGQWRLFDSTEPRSHARAAAICRTCPAIGWCRQEVKAQRSKRGGVVSGTWAGRLYNPEKRAREAQRRRDAARKEAS